MTHIEVTYISTAEIAYLMTCYFENAPAFQNSSAYLTTYDLKNVSASGRKPPNPPLW